MPSHPYCFFLLTSTAVAFPPLLLCLILTAIAVFFLHYWCFPPKHTYVSHHFYCCAVVSKPLPHPYCCFILSLLLYSLAPYWCFPSSPAAVYIQPHCIYPSHCFPQNYAAVLLVSSHLCCCFPTTLLLFPSQLYYFSLTPLPLFSASYYYWCFPFTPISTALSLTSLWFFRTHFNPAPAVVLGHLLFISLLLLLYC